MSTLRTLKRAIIRRKYGKEQLNKRFKELQKRTIIRTPTLIPGNINQAIKKRKSLWYRIKRLFRKLFSFKKY